MALASIGALLPTTQAGWAADVEQSTQIEAIVFAQSTEDEGVPVPDAVPVTLRNADGDVICEGAGADALSGDCTDADAAFARSEGIVAVLAPTDADDATGLLQGALHRTDEGMLRVAFSPGAGSILVAGTQGNDEAFPQLDPAEYELATITVPTDCGRGVRTAEKLILIVNGSCADTELLTFRLPEGETGFEVQAPQDKLENRAELDLTPATGRGGGVSLRTRGAEPVAAQRGLRVSFSINDQPCGTSDVNENGAYAVSLSSPPCTTGQLADVAIVASELTTTVDLGVTSRLDLSFTEPEGRSLFMGRALVDDSPATDGETLTVTGADGASCGTATVQLDGAYLLLVPAECADAARLSVELGDGATASLSPPDDGSPVVNLAFSTPTTTTTTAPTPASNTRVEPFLNRWAVTALLIIILALGALSIVARWATIGRDNVVQPLIDAAAQDPDKYELREIRDIAAETSPNFRVAFELTLLVTVTVAVVTLTLGGVVSEQGALTILGTVVGYAVGRAVR